MKKIKKTLQKIYLILVQKMDNSLNKLQDLLDQYGFEYFNEMPPMVKVKQEVKK